MPNNKRRITNTQAIYKYVACLMDNTQTSLAHSNIFYSTTTPGHKARNRIIALDVIQHAIEDILRWTPDQALSRLNSKIIREYKLDDAVKKVELPEGMILDNDYSYLLKQIYPYIQVNKKDLTVRYFKTVLDDSNNKSFVKRYFAGADGRERSAICLNYLLSIVIRFWKNPEEDPEDIYEFFSGVGGDRFLSTNKLKLAKQLYTSDVEYLHNSLPNSCKDDFIFHYYQAAGLFWGAKRKLARISRANEKVARAGFDFLEDTDTDTDETDE